MVVAFGLSKIITTIVLELPIIFLEKFEAEWKSHLNCRPKSLSFFDYGTSFPSPSSSSF